MNVVFWQQYFLTTNNLHNSTLPFFDLSLLTDVDGTNINNEDMKEFKEKIIYSILQLLKSLRKNQRF